MASAFRVLIHRLFSRVLLPFFSEQLVVRSLFQIHHHQSELDQAFETFASVQRYVDRCRAPATFRVLDDRAHVRDGVSTGKQPFFSEACAAYVARYCLRVSMDNLRRSS